MKGRKGFTLIELLVVIAIIAILAAILFPVFAKARRTAQTSTCASNMKQIGNGIKMYLSDWEDTYPTNRFTNAASQALVTEVPLSINMSTGTYGKQGDPKINPSTGKPVRFVGRSAGSSMAPTQNSGANWVEGLYNYVETVTRLDDPSSIWKCPAVVVKGRNDGQYSTVSYVFNYNLVEASEGMVKNAGNLMMLREIDGYLHAACRPTTLSTGSYENTPPANAFLVSTTQHASDRGSDGYTVTTPTPNYKLHGVGSHILFADGHVKLIPVSVVSKAYYHCSGTSTDDDGVWFESTDRKIAITPN